MRYAVWTVYTALNLDLICEVCLLLLLTAG